MLVLQRVVGRAACPAASAWVPRRWSSSTPGQSNVADVAKVLGEAKRVLVMTGAGLSTPSGIPDFRTPGSGIYDNLQKYDLPYPEAIFDIDYFRQRPEPFCTWAKEFWPTGAKYRPNTAHYFIRLLHEKGALLRLYTQNIDGLEYLSGVPEDKIVAAHGSFTSAACVTCRAPQDVKAVRAAILAGETPRCHSCDGAGGGLVKPDIVFFGEALPPRFFSMLASDVGGFGGGPARGRTPDALVCIGTSLAVQPFASIAEEVPHDVPRVLINRERVGSFGERMEDYLLLGDLVGNVEALAEALGWQGELRGLVEAGAAAA